MCAKQSGLVCASRFVLLELLPDYQALIGVHRYANVCIALEDQILAGLIQRRAKLREAPQRERARLHQEDQRCELDLASRSLLLARLAKDLEFRDVRLIVLGDVRNVEPATR